MKKVIIMMSNVFLVLTLLYVNANAQSVSATWQLTPTNPTAVTTSGSINALPMTLSNLIIRDYSGPIGPLGDSSQRVNPGLSAAWTSPSYSQSNYYEFKVSATATQPFTITSISIPMGGQNTNNMRAELQYSTDDFASTVQTLNPVTVVLPSGSYLPSTQVQYNTYIPVAAGRTLSVRVFPFLASASTNTSRYIYLQNVVINGTTNAVAPPTPQPAFPGAEGAGKYVTGGRGTSTIPTTVFEVTNLLDNNSPGSLRYACVAPATYRTIVFRVSGTIHLNSNLLIPGNTTVAGQTAPGDGICLADRQVSVAGHNVIVRNMRFRMGDRYQNMGMVVGGGDSDAFNGIDKSRIIIDHCTMAWSTDEACTFYGGDSVTLQWNIISEPLNYSYHYESGTDYDTHGLGGLWGARNATFHHNLIAHCLGRYPRLSGSNNYSPSVEGNEKADLVNNVMYNWGPYSVDGGSGGRYNIMNNYYKYGPNFNGGNKNGVPRKYEIMQMGKSAPLTYGKVFLSGNYMDGNTFITNNNWLGMAMETAQVDTALAKVTSPFPSLQPLTLETAVNAYNSVLQRAGAILPKRDTLDQRIVNDVINRTGKHIDVQGGFPHGTAYALTVNAWPTLNSLPAPVDTDHDGMPDNWEIRRGLNAANADDRNNYTNNGYSNVENYLNGDSSVASGSINTCVTAKKINVINGSGWEDAKDTSYSYIISTDTTNVVASIKRTSSLGEFNTSYYVTNTTRLFNGKPYLNRNVTITPTSTVSAPVTVRLYLAKAEYDSLKASDVSISSTDDLRVLRTADNTCITSIATADVIVPTSTGVWGTYSNGYYVEFQTSSFGTFFLASQSFAVPLKLITFDGTAKKESVDLTWQTSNEINVDKFDVERSTDATSFKKIGTVKAVNSQALNKYAYTDNIAFKGNLYYRLKLVDKDGSYTYSKVVVVNHNNKNTLGAFPNPAKNKVVVTHSVALNDAVLKVVSTNGMQVFSQFVRQGTSVSNINIEALNSGSYFIIFQNGNTVEKIQLVKE